MYLSNVEAECISLNLLSNKESFIKKNIIFWLVLQTDLCVFYLHQQLLINMNMFFIPQDLTYQACVFGIV
jgi:hypothetical protein